MPFQPSIALPLPPGTVSPSAIAPTGCRVCGQAEYEFPGPQGFPLRRCVNRACQLSDWIDWPTLETAVAVAAAADAKAVTPVTAPTT